MTVTTAAFAAQFEPIPSVVLGTVTGVGGGTVRGVEIREVPTALSSGPYAIPAACAATLTALALAFHLYGGTIVVVVVAAVCFSPRMLGVRFELNVPVSHPSVTAKTRSPSEEDS